MPEWLREQYERWNPTFKARLEKLVSIEEQEEPDPGRVKVERPRTNGALLRMLRRHMIGDDQRRAVEKAEKSNKPEADHESDIDPPDAASDSDGGGDLDRAAGEVADAKLQDPVEVIREDVPAVGGAAQDEDLPGESNW